jgi:hypothetical protein
MDYSIHEHKHRFSAWAASRAATVIRCRFSVEQGKAILEAADLRRLLLGPTQLPEPQDVDDAHRQWRVQVVAAAGARGLDFTHGVAAKLINVYLKAGFTCGGHDDEPRVQALHPPLDSLLLDELWAKDIGGLRADWAKARMIRWSKFSSDQYESVIASIRTALGRTLPLWHVEQYWRGYQ